MSRFILTKTAAPATPAANKSAVYVDTSTRRISQIDDTGVISNLVQSGQRDASMVTNGGFTIQQRCPTALTSIVGISTTTRAGVVSDRWAVTTGNVTTCLWQQVDTSASPETALSSRYYGRITQNTNAAKFILSQFIINAEMAHLRGQQVRLSCKIKQIVGSAANYRLGLLQLTSAGTVDVCPAFISAIGANGVDPTWGTNLAAIVPDASPVPENGTISGGGLTIASTVNWVKSSCVFTVPANAKNLMVVIYRDTIGGVSDSVGIAEVQLTQGPEIVDWVPVAFTQEQMRCLRFFCKTFGFGVTPGTSAGINTGEAKGVAGKAGAVANAGIIAWRFPIPMFATPTLTLYNPAAGNALMRNLTGAADMGATVATAQLDASAMVIATGVAATAVGDQVGIHMTADCEYKN